MAESFVIVQQRAKPPRIRKLNSREIEYVLARNCVARIAFNADNRIELQPVHYVYRDGAVYGRIAVGAKYLNWLVEKDVVIEVDETVSLFDWRSVVLRGAVSLLRACGTPKEREEHDHAVQIIRMLIPGAFTDRDPTPDRTFLFRVDPSEMTGREASTR
jgi:nitroimidazol reductase NimA-like FMN-containing flavoprotein (pyridoxamine 5'-phosphate oxidase superfamily)